MIAQDTAGKQFGLRWQDGQKLKRKGNKAIMITKLSEIAEHLEITSRGDLPYAPNDKAEIELINIAQSELDRINAASRRLWASLEASRALFSEGAI